MKEFIEKLIGRLEEEHERCINRYGVLGGNLPAMEVKQCMEIVNQLAEEYNNESVKWDLISRSAVIKELNGIYLDNPYDDKEDILEKTIGIVDHFPTAYNGWIPCSELPEENGMYLCTVFHADDYVVWIMRFNDGEFLKPDDVEDWNYELLAWTPIAPYQPKGE